MNLLYLILYEMPHSKETDCGAAERVRSTVMTIDEDAMSGTLVRVTRELAKAEGWTKAVIYQIREDDILRLDHWVEPFKQVVVLRLRCNGCGVELTKELVSPAAKDMCRDCH